MDILSNVLGAKTLPPELMSSLQEAFEKKVAEAREQAELSIREEFSRRYEHDKANLVEAMDRMLTDVVKKHEESKLAETKKLAEARVKFRTATKEARANYKKKIEENVAASRKFVVEQLAKEVKKLREKRQAMVAEALQQSESVEILKKTLVKEHAQRVKAIDSFVVKQVNKELTEFAQDHKALVETRVKLVAESRKKLAETQKRFVKESAKKLQVMIEGHLKKEMKQLHEDLERNRQNMFGRRLFEAFAAEYMTSYLAEGTEIRKLQKVIEAKEKELSDAKSKLVETAKEAETVSRKAKLAEDRVTRTKIMSELLSNLRGDKRSVMEGLLETTKTENLRPTFEKLLPVVLAEGGRKPSIAPTAPKKILSETREKKPAITGDQRVNRLYEATQEEADLNNEIAHVVRLAGINNR